MEEGCSTGMKGMIVSVDPKVSVVKKIKNSRMKMRMDSMKG